VEPLRSDILASVSEAPAAPLALPESLADFQGVAVAEVVEKNKMVMVNIEFAVEGLGFAAGGGRVVVDMPAVGEVLECMSEVAVGRILVAGMKENIVIG